MKKRNRFLALLLTAIFALASVQITFAADLVSTKDPKVIQPNTVITGSLKGEYDWDCYSFYSGGGSYSVLLYTKTPYIDTDYGEIDMRLTLDYGALRFYSVNKGWQKPVHHLDDGYTGFAFEGTADVDGWYVTSVPIGKYKAGKRVGLGVSSEVPGEYKLEVIGKTYAAPAQPVIKSVKGKKRSMVVKWKKAANAKGYLIQISNRKGYGRNYKEITVSGSKASTTIKNLKAGTYYVNICSFKKVNGVTSYSDWSKAKKVKVK